MTQSTLDSIFPVDDVPDDRAEGTAYGFDAMHDDPGYQWAMYLSNLAVIKATLPPEQIPPVLRRDIDQLIGES